MKLYIYIYIFTEFIFKINEYFKKFLIEYFRLIYKRVISSKEILSVLIYIIYE